MRAVLFILSVSACTTGGDPSVEGAQAVGPAEPGAPPASCPDRIDGGPLTLTSNGLVREAEIVLPTDPTPGMPVLFVWHGMGGNGRYIARSIGARRIAEAHRAIVVVPLADPANWLEWGFMNGGEDDLAFTDDLRACLYRVWDVDLERIYTTGFSAGGLWSSFLSVHRSDVFAAALPFSGGADPVWPYETPAEPIPVALVHGGARDTWGAAGFAVAFETTSQNLADDLAKDGHTVVVCDHGGGHTVPEEAEALVSRFLFSHTWGRPSPFSGGDLTDLPDYCGLVRGE